MTFSEKNTGKIHGKWESRTFFVRTFSVLFAAVFSVQILCCSGCSLFQAKKTAQFPQQTLPQQIQPQQTASAVPANEPLDQKYAAFKPVLPQQALPPQNSNNGDYANIVDNIFGKSTISGTPSTVKMLPVPESVQKKPAEIAADKDIINKDKEQIEQLNKKIISLEKSLAEKDKQLSVQAAKPADKVSEQPVPPQKTPIPEPNKNTEKPLPLPNTEKKPEPQKEFKTMAPLGIAGVIVSTDTAKRQTRIEIPDSILFQPNSWTIQPDAEKHLRKIFGEIRACYPEAVLDIEGHTDNIDRDPVNKTQKHDIASFKSMTVMQYFVKSLMWDASKITSSSYGSGKPVSDNGTPEGRARNNRIEIVVKS